MRQGRLAGQFWSAFITCNTNFKDAVDWSLQQIDITRSRFPSNQRSSALITVLGTHEREYVAKYPEMELTNDPWSAKKAMNEGKIASTIGLEGGHMIGSRLSILRTD